jgi:hypothetical protein
LEKGNKAIMKKLILLFVTLVPTAGFAQSYSLSWYKIAAGGGAGAGTNGGSVYSVRGTLGQQDANPTVEGGSYAVTGGFWALYSVQTPGLPNLVITQSGGSAVVSWADTGNYRLLTNGNVATTNWVAYTGAVSTNNGTASVTISPPNGILYFRLYGP